MIGIIGGTGFCDPDFISNEERIKIETKYGDLEVILGRLAGKKITYIPRHGMNHEIPPHMVDYRRNILALKLTGTERIISINSVGSLEKHISPGSIVVPNDFIEFTNNRRSTFFDSNVVHVDMTDPYCPSLRESLIRNASKVYDTVLHEAVYVTTQGPRFETKAEIRMLKQLGGHVVGMVGFPEVVLAREAGLCYGSICTVTNFGCGIGPEPLSVDEVSSVIDLNKDKMKKTLKSAIKQINSQKTCDCSDPVNEIIL